MKGFSGRIDDESMDTRTHLDKKDQSILEVLTKDSRLPISQIAKKVRLSRDSVQYRMHKLQRGNIILGFYPVLNYEILGFYVFHIFLLLDEMNKEEQKKLLNYLNNNPNIISIIEYSDRWDLEVVLIARSLHAFDKIMLNMATKFPDLILEKDKLEIIKRYQTNAPLLGEKESIKPRKFKLSSLDINIINALGHNARISNYELARKFKVSPDTIRYHINNLVEEGIILHFTALLNLSKLNYYWYTFSVEMKMFDQKNENKFKEFLRQNPNILRAAKTLGGWDLLLYVIVDKRREFHRVVKDLKKLFAPIVRNYDTWVAYKEHKFNPVPEIITIKTLKDLQKK